MVSRRKFIATSALFLSQKIWPQFPSKTLQNDDFLISYITHPRDYLIYPKDQVPWRELLVYNLRNHSERKCIMPTHPHSFLAHPQDPNYLLAMSKWQHDICLFNLKDLSVTKQIKSPLPEEFMGHGVFTENEKELLVSQGTYIQPSPELKGKGFISIRDPYSLKEFDRFDSFGIEPHGLVTIDKNKTLVICNAGSRTHRETEDTITWPNVSLVDIKTRKLIKRFFMPDNHHIGPAHITKNQKDEVFIATKFQKSPNHPPFKSRDCVPLKISTSKQMQVFEIPKEVQGRLQIEMLNILVHPTRPILLATIPSNNILLTWNTETLKLINYFNLPRARGISITKDNQNFIINTDEGIRTLSANTLKLSPEVLFPRKLIKAGLRGAHSLIV